MKTVIWDLDGTIIDSYPFIVKVVSKMCAEQSIELSDDEILNILKLQSSKELFELMSSKCELSKSELKKMNDQRIEEFDSQMELIEYVREVLAKLNENGVVNHIYTHKNNATYDVIKNLAIDHFFSEIVTIENGFARKPAPDALLYIVEKFNLSKENTYYVGDRLLDVRSANAAGLKSIFYHPKGLVLDEANFNIDDMREILMIVK